MLRGGARGQVVIVPRYPQEGHPQGVPLRHFLCARDVSVVQSFLAFLCAFNARAATTARLERCRYSVPMQVQFASRP